MITTQPHVQSVLDEIGHGYLGVSTPEGWPLVFALNFVRIEERIYFHGDHSGEKMRAIESEPRVSFTVVDAGSLIPSYLRHPRSACPATQYYRSVMLRGRARVVDTSQEKAAALQALMEKLQPEGGHLPIRPDEAFYRKSLRGTAVVAIEVESATGREKFGQNLGQRAREAVLRGLAERDSAVDRLTIERMQRVAPGP